MKRIFEFGRTLLAVAVLWSAGCGGMQGDGFARHADLAAAGSAVLVVEGPPADAWVFIDGQLAGQWARTAGAFEVPAGTRRLRIEAAGHLVFRREISLTAGEVYDVEVELWPCFSGVDPDCG